MDKKLSYLDELFMEEAIKEAKKALKKGEVPVGAIIVKNEQIVGRGYNLKETHKDPIYHAEIIAIRKAVKKIGDWRLYDSIIYVTLEPCLMCFGAIVNSRIRKIVYGAENIEEGFSKFITDIKSYLKWKKIEVIAGVKKDECETLLKAFFKSLRSSRL